MPTFPLTWYAIAALLVSNVFTTYMWRTCAHDLQLVQLQSEIADARSKSIIAEQKKITEDTTVAWKAALDVTRTDWAKRLRVANVQPMPGISGPTGGIASLPTDSLALAAQCAETTDQLIALQNWVKKQQLVN